MSDPERANVALGDVLEGLGDAVVVIDGQGLVMWGNEAGRALFGLSLDAAVGTSSLDLLHPEDRELAMLALASVQAKSVGTPLEVRVRTPAGWRLVELVGAPMHSAADGTIAISLRDLTQRRRWEVAGGEIAKFRSLIHNAAAVTMLISPDGTVDAVSGALTRLLGQDPEMVQGRPLSDLVDVRDRPRLSIALARAAALPPTIHGKPVTVEVCLSRPAGEDTIPFELTIVNLLEDPTVCGFVISGHDITQLRAAQQKLQDLANCDGLTGLANRAALDRHLATAVADVTTADHPAVVAFVDLDRFKPINDLLGHGAGDELLRCLATRLQAAVKDGDFVARFGGDEFVVVVHPDGTESGDPNDLVERLEEVVAEPFQLSSGPAQVFGSVGVATAHAGHTAETLLSEADARMYAVKRSRRGNPAEPAMVLSERRLMAEQLAVGLADDQLVVHYQPIVVLATGEVSGYEALVRWQHPERGLLMPAVFLGVAEDAGREAELGEFVLREACARLAALDAGSGTGFDTAEPGTLSMSVNLSVGQLAGDGFVRLVETVLREHGLAPARLCLEITERTILERPAHGPTTPVRITLDSLAALGVRLAIDDFGTGYSSLTHLLQFPVQVLKIDRSFVSGVGSDRQRHSVVAAVIELARGMGIDAVAEGIERPDQLEALQELGCAFGQGYLLGRPVAAAPFEQGRRAGDLSLIGATSVAGRARARRAG